MDKLDFEHEIIELYKTGFSGREINEKTGVKMYIIYRTLRSFSVTIRANRTPGKIEQEFLIKRAKLIKSLRLAGCTWKEIGKQFGVTYQCVHQFMSRYLSCKNSPPKS